MSKDTWLVFKPVSASLKLMLFLLINVARRGFLEEWNVSRTNAGIRWGWAERLVQDRDH